MMFNRKLSADKVFTYCYRFVIVFCCFTQKSLRFSQVIIPKTKQIKQKSLLILMCSPTLSLPNSPSPPLPSSFYRLEKPEGAAVERQSKAQTNTDICLYILYIKHLIVVCLCTLLFTDII